MKRWKFIVSYDGTNYNGFAKQPNVPTIQETLEEVIHTLTQEDVKVIGSGRTDTGVHAKCQHCLIETNTRIPIERFAKAMNAKLPRDISIRDVEVADEDFHPTYSIKEKTYQYKILNGETRDPFVDKYTYFYPYKLDLQKIQEAAKYIEGTHDFSCFCATGATTKTSVRTVFYLDIKKEEDIITLEICGNGFLYNMVRIIVGTLIQIGIGKVQPEAIKQIILSKDRMKAGPTAPAKGLVMYSSKY